MVSKNPKHKRIKIHDDIRQFYIKNKYFRTFLVSYYAYTRGITVFEAMETLIKDDELINEANIGKTLDECIKYFANQDIALDSSEIQNIEDNFVAPETKHRPSQLNHMLNEIADISGSGDKED